MLGDPLQRNVQLLQVIDVLFSRGKLPHDLSWCIAVLEGMKLNLLVDFFRVCCRFVLVFSSHVIVKILVHVVMKQQGRQRRTGDVFVAIYFGQQLQANVQTTGWDAKRAHVGLITDLPFWIEYEENYFEKRGRNGILCSAFGLLKALLRQTDIKFLNSPSLFPLNQFRHIFMEKSYYIEGGTKICCSKSETDLIISVMLFAHLVVQKHSVCLGVC